MPGLLVTEQELDALVDYILQRSDSAG